MMKTCIQCSLPKIKEVDFDIDDHDLSGYNARCKECLGTLPIAEVPKPKRSKKRSKPRKKVNIQEEPVEVPVMNSDEVAIVDVPVVAPDNENIEDDD